MKILQFLKIADNIFSVSHRGNLGTNEEISRKTNEAILTRFRRVRRCLKY